jgi:hypothetical protein
MVDGGFLERKDEEGIHRWTKGSGGKKRGEDDKSQRF